MTKKDFNCKVSKMREYIKGAQVEVLRDEFIQRGIRDPFTYGAWCEKNFECNLREDYKRKTTFTSDFSIAEWCVCIEGTRAIFETLSNALKNWRDDVEFFAELLLVLNMKSWEHDARGNYKYSRLYANIFYYVKDLYFEWFDEEHTKHEEAMQYYFDYVD